MDLDTLRSFYSGIEILREYWPEMPIQTAATFLAIASAKDQVLTQHELQFHVKLAQSTLSKNVYYLCEWRKQGVKGAGLIRQVPDPLDRRHRLVMLTPKGEEVARRIIQALS